MHTTLIERLISARKDKNWTQVELAKALNVNLKNVQRWEQGSSKPSFEAAAELAKVLGVSLDYLAGLSHSPTHGGVKQEVATLLAQVPKNKLEAIQILLS